MMLATFLSKGLFSFQHLGENMYDGQPSWHSLLSFIYKRVQRRDYEEIIATTPEEIMERGKAGWAKYDELTVNGIQIHFYRKPKSSGGLKTSLT